MPVNQRAAGRTRMIHLIDRHFLRELAFLEYFTVLSERFPALQFKHAHSGYIQPAYSRMDWFWAILSDWSICFLNSLGDICITLVK